MIYIFIGLTALLILFLYCACKVSSNCSRIEELEAMKNKNNRNL